MTTRIKLRRDTAANWTANNPILAAGEPGLETDTGKTKYGNGTTPWAGLSYATGGITARTAIGNFVGYGPSIPNYNGYDAYFETVVADPDGNAYYVGGHNDGDDTTIVVKVDSEGSLLWQNEITWADGYEGWGSSAVYNTATDQLYVLAHQARNGQLGFYDDSAAIYVLDPADGTLVSDPTVLRDDVSTDGSETGWITPIDITLTSGGDPVVVGEKGGNADVYSVTSATGSTVNVLFVDSAQFINSNYPIPYNNWYLTGTNIASNITITAVNLYQNQPATALPHNGTGCTFAITDVGDGTYSVTAFGGGGGSGYSIGNKILVLGTDLGGATPDNDGTITITGVDSGAITSVSINGNAVMNTGTSYPNVSGTNIASGYNATFSAVWRMKGSEIYFPDYQSTFGVATYQSGNDFVVGDTLALPAASYGGTTTGTITVTAVNAGAISNWTFTGTFNTSTIKLTTDQSVDFGVEGNWQVLGWGSQGFLWTPDWGATFGGSEWDTANAVARDSADNIYVAMRTYDRSVNNGQTRGQLVKVSSTGTLVWSKNFDPAGYDYWADGYTGVVVDSNDDVIVVQAEQITKVDSSGTVLWQKQVEPGAPFDMWNGCVDIDSDDNIYWAAEYSYMGQPNNDAFLIIKFDTDGNVLWQREAGAVTGNNSNWNDACQIITVQGNRFYISGSSYQGNDDIAIGMTFPTDGSGDSANSVGRYFYNTTTWTLSTTTGTVDVMEIDFRSSEFTVYTTNTFAVNTLTNVSEARTVRTGDVDGRIEDLYSVSFEDGTVQTTAYTGGISQSGNSPFIYNTNGYYLKLSDAGKFIRWQASGWSNSVNIYIPNNDDVAFPVGTQIHFIKDQGIRAFMFWNGYNANDNDITILPSSPNFDSGMQNYMYDSGEGWSVHHLDIWNNDYEIPCKVTLTKIDTNRWLLSCDSPSQVMDWNW